MRDNFATKEIILCNGLKDLGSGRLACLQSFHLYNIISDISNLRRNELFCVMVPEVSVHGLLALVL